MGSAGDTVRDDVCYPRALRLHGVAAFVVRVGETLVVPYGSYSQGSVVYRVMSRTRILLVGLACLVLLAGCSGGPETDTTVAPTDAEPATEHTTAEPTTVGTPATRTAVPTLTGSTEVTDPPDPRAVGTNFEPNRSLDTIYRRVEALRGLTARERVNVSVHGIDIVNPETNERMQVGDPFDYPDDAAGMGETQTKVLQLYSSEPVPLRGVVAAGMARATAVNVANESAYERIADDSFETLLVQIGRAHV